MRFRRRSKGLKTIVEDLNVTPYMNLMAVLIPFLLSVAVFTRIAVLEIYLPPPSEESQEIQEEKEEPPLSLTVIIGEEGILVTNRDSIIGFVPVGEEGHQYKDLSKIVKGIKKLYPGEESAVILSKPDTPYGTLISVMDSVQTTETRPRLPLFPNISLGEVQ